MGPGQGFLMLPSTKNVEHLGPGQLLHPKDRIQLSIDPKMGSYV